MKQLFLVTINLIGVLQLFSQVNPPIASQIDAIFQDYEGQPGCAVAIVKNGQPIFEQAYGFANLTYEIPITTETIFEVASNSKQFTAACIFLLEQEGKLKLDDPIQKYLPELPSYSNNIITIQNLLHHTSGLRSYLATLHAKNDYWGNAHDNEDVVKILERHQGLNFLPGTRYAYSNSNYALLATIVSRVSGQSLGAYAKKKLFDPLGMKHTFFREKKDTVVKNIATGYEAVGDYYKRLHHYNNTVVGDGGLHTNIEDFVRWSNNLKEGTIGGEALVKSMLTLGRLNNGQPIIYAGGLFYENHYNLDGLPRIAHSGEWAGFRSLYYKFLNQDLAIILLSNNASTNVWSLLDQLVPLFLKEEVSNARQRVQNEVESETRPFPMTKSEKEKFCGPYYSQLNGYLREIKLEGDQLVYIRPGAAPRTLIPISSQELVYEGMPFVKFAFKQKHFNSFALTINDLNSVSYQKYAPVHYKESALKQYENQYYNEDIDDTYQIMALKNGLQILVDEEEIFNVKPIAQDLFTSDHSGYLKFKRNSKGVVIGFSQFDDLLHNLQFEAQLN